MKNNRLSVGYRLWRKRRLLVVMIGALVVVSGCFSLQRHTSEKKFYSLEATTVPASAPVPAPLPTLLVKDFSIAPLYISNSFVYRRAEYQFETDYYNEFIIPPQRMITATVKQALFDARKFSAALPHRPADHRLQGRIIRLYGDFRQAGRSLAVMEIALSLDAADEKIFSKEMEISDRTPQTLVGGWNRLLEEIITEFIDTLPRVTPGS